MTPAPRSTLASDPAWKGRASLTQRLRDVRASDGHLQMARRRAVGPWPPEVGSASHTFRRRRCFCQPLRDIGCRPPCAWRIRAARSHLGQESGTLPASDFEGLLLDQLVTLRRRRVPSNRVRATFQTVSSLSIRTGRGASPTSGPLVVCATRSGSHCSHAVAHGGDPPPRTRRRATPCRATLDPVASRLPRLRDGGVVRA